MGRALVWRGGLAGRSWSWAGRMISWCLLNGGCARRGRSGGSPCRRIRLRLRIAGGSCSLRLGIRRLRFSTIHQWYSPPLLHFPLRQTPTQRNTNAPRPHPGNPPHPPPPHLLLLHSSPQPYRPAPGHRRERRPPHPLGNHLSNLHPLPLLGTAFLLHHRRPDPLAFLHL